jgi:parallel beta-helix repeat protein
LFAVYHVAVEGSNSASGESPSAAWATLQHAADQVAAGDTVLVAPGAYEGFYLDTSGSALQPIVFRAETGVVIDRPNATTPDGINLEGASHVTIEGFEVTGAPRAGIRSVINEHVVIRNNRAIDNGRWGIFTGFSEDLLIENNEAAGSDIEHGIYVSNSADRPVIRGNRVWGNQRSGIQINADASEGGDGIIDHAIIEHNVIFDNGVQGGSAINLDGVHDSDIRNNLLYDNHASGISLYQIDGGDSSRNNRVINNTVINATNGRWALNIQDESTGNLVLNNILFSEHSFRGAVDISPGSLPGLVSDYNVVESRYTTSGGDHVLSLVEWRAATGHDANSRTASLDSLFRDLVNHDYRLLASSPAVGAGTSHAAAPARDLDGVPRPQGDRWDAGAFEYSEALLGDFDRSGVVDARDIDALFAALRESDSDPRWDLNSDGQVSAVDADFLITEILRTQRGDVNLDGVVDASDLGVIRDHLFTETSLWEAGDVNGDGLVDVRDYNVAYIHRGSGVFAKVSRPAAVPAREWPAATPSSTWLASDSTKVKLVRLRMRDA